MEVVAGGGKDGVEEGDLAVVAEGVVEVNVVGGHECELKGVDAVAGVDRVADERGCDVVEGRVEGQQGVEPDIGVERVADAVSVLLMIAWVNREMEFDGAVAAVDGGQDME